jgi:nucleoid-associated protein YgaU
LLFKGRCTGLNIAYKLFNPDGAPIRAICKVTFKEFKEENLRVAEENNQSPDLTHYRVVKKGDTLPLLCFLIYGDSRHYLEVARANKLVNFRNLTVGEELSFPPFDKAAVG